MMVYDIIVIGAGAAGLIAAGKAAERGAKVLLLEKKERVGRKMLISGKGRCNITNNSSQSNHFKNIHPNGRYLKHAYNKFFVKHILEILEKEKVDVKTERGDRVFPVSDKSKDVVDALYSYANKKNVDIKYHTTVEKILTENKRVTGVKINENGSIKEVFCKNVIIATGGKSYPATGSTGDGYTLAHQLGHTIIKPRPALVPIITSGDVAEKLMGLSLKNVNAMLWVNNKKINEEFGEMLFAHFGLTGPIILTLSKHAVDAIDKKDKVKISIDLKPALDNNKLDARLLRDIDEHKKKNVDNIFKLWLPGKLVPVFLEILKIDPKKNAHQISAKERKSILLLMKNFEFEVTGYRGFKEAIITAGGVSTDEVNGKTMQSNIIEGLYFAGEVLDLDANTGGYNFQIAYSTGWLAADSCMF